MATESYLVAKEHKCKNRAKIVNEEKVLRYIHQNPLKAGVTEDISVYLWSSYHEYLKTPVLTDIDFVLDIFSQDRINSLTLFRAYTNEEYTDEYLEYMEKTNLPDQEVIDYLNTLEIVSISELQRLEKGQRMIR